jgi:PhzF family phenazine biosynthesis protein
VSPVDRKSAHPPDFFHVDVFASGPLTGNGLAVFLRSDGWSSSTMLRLTQEMRQFESIFLSDVSRAGATARVFTVEEELPFAGHPVLGAAAVLHAVEAPDADDSLWSLKLPLGTVPVSTKNLGDHYRCELNAGVPVVGRRLSPGELEPALRRLGLAGADVVDGLPARVVSTGLPYLIVPVVPDALAKAAIQGTDFESVLGAIGAKFVLVLDVEAREMRTWDNLGRVEDVATGSAAGPAAAFLRGAGLADPSSPTVLAQGRFVGRPSRIDVVHDADGSLRVSGDVWPVSRGFLDVDVNRMAPPADSRPR